ncbi:MULTISPECIES: caspase family protein [unclassified Streptomyces]|uniref:caspase family protein n=1 Tax=unclassified Streptomyces TaxID=2593676 RepID=UPI002DDBD760|nr:caspase family protein [Streptomyces sp. NBC_01761]WSC56795.1 caspase family protein [Streptomyces sp. NBC_01761]WSF87637.1 caspase family protein [Streptomyces sp. NBC_01744]
MTQLSDPAASRAVLIGTHSYEAMEDLPTVKNNVSRLAELLHDGTMWGLPSGHSTVLLQPTRDAVLDAVHAALAEATDTVLLYYAGHGLSHPMSGELYLALPNSEQRRLDRALRYEDLRGLLLDPSIGGQTPARRKVVILDCCWSGLALGGLMSEGHGIGARADVSGTFVLTATSETRQSLAPPGEQYTSFTGELIDAIAGGIEGAPAFLSMSTLYDHLAQRMAAKSLPHPQQRNRNSSGHICLFRNRAEQAPLTPASGGRVDGHDQVSDGPHGAAPRPGNPHETRHLLLARMARAMKATLARPTMLSRGALGKDVAQPQSPAKTTVQTTSWSSSPASFEVSWTGQEPVSAFAARPRVVGPWLSAVLFSSVAVASFYFPLHLGLITPGAPGAGDNPWIAVPALGGSIAGLLGLGFALSAIAGTFMRGKHALARKARSGWSLHVGPDGISTDSAAGRQEFPWEQIQRVIIEGVQGSLPYQFTGVHVDLESGATRPTMLRPAGWLYPQPDTVRVLPRGRIPVCVLGPMTERQRTELIEAISGYGGQRWVPAVHFTTLTADL